jgi:ribokinase
MNLRTLNANLTLTRYRALIGTGGIGSGMFFALDGIHTLGREESRSGHFLERRDYCKLHIVSHYVSKLLGNGFPVIPLGMVGTDEVGGRLLAEMAEVGLDTRYVGRAEGRGTLYALCLIYPDGSGGNVTENDSACAAVDADWIAQAEVEFARYAGRGIALALPEVPLDARRALLALGTAHGFLRVASFTTAEILELVGKLHDIDLLALNLDEAAALAGISTEMIDSGSKTTDHSPGVEASAGFSHHPPDRLEPRIQEDRFSPPAPPDAAWTSVLKGALARLDPETMLVVTAGARGSWSWDGKTLTHRPALSVPVAGTAGAGDAHLAGIIAGLAAGLPLQEAHQLGVLTAAVAVQSPHTINFELDRETLWACARATGMPLAGAVQTLLAPTELSVGPPVPI